MRGSERRRLSRQLPRTFTRAATAPAERVAELEGVRRFYRRMSHPQILQAAIVCLLVTLGGGLFFVDQHGYVPRPSRLRVERLQREEDSGVAPSASDYHFAISFDSDGFTISDLRSFPRRRKFTAMQPPKAVNHARQRSRSVRRVPFN